MWDDVSYLTPEEARQKLVVGNRIFRNAIRNPAEISNVRRSESEKNGQTPYAVILSCSDSRVPPEHIFSAGIGDLFVIRTAGNVVGNFELGSIEYAVEHLYVPLIVVMGHDHCGAVEAALEGYADGYIETIVDEIQRGIKDATGESDAVYNNIMHSKRRVLKSEIVRHLIEQGKLEIIGAEYDMKSGGVTFLEDGKYLWRKGDEEDDWRP